MTRIPPRSPSGLFARFVAWFAARTLGKVPTSLRVLFGHAKVLSGYVNMERAQQAATRVPASLKALVQIRAATLVGCPF